MSIADSKKINELAHGSARKVHLEDYHDPAFSPDVLNTVRDYTQGFIECQKMMAPNAPDSTEK